MAPRFDRRAAADQARIDRLEEHVDRARGRPGHAADGHGEDYGVSPDELDDFHVASRDSPLPDDDEPAHVYCEAEDVTDALAGGFNARDVDGVLDLCAAECDVPGLASDLDDVGGALDDLWLRRPSITMTRMVVDDHAVGVLWEQVAAQQWATIGTVHATVDDDRIVVMEFSDDLEMLDRRQPAPPDEDDPIWQNPNVWQET